MSSSNTIFYGIDLGTTTIKVAVGEFRADGTLVLRGLGEAESLKMLKAEPQADEVVAEQLRVAFGEALRSAGLPPRLDGPVALSLSGGYVRPVVVTGEVEVPENMPVDDEIMEAALGSVNALAPEAENCERLPTASDRRFRLSDGRVLFNPCGQCTSRLQSEAWFFLAESARMWTVLNVVEKLFPGHRLDYVCYAPLAIASAVLPPQKTDERFGLVIDLGGGMTTLAMPTNIGHLVCEQLALGGDHIAHDLAFGLKIPIGAGNQLLREMEQLHCTAVATHDGVERIVSISIENSKRCQCTADAVETIVEARLQEISELCRKRLQEREALDWLGDEIVLSGDVARIPRITELASKVFNRKVRVASPYLVDSGGVQLYPRHNAVLGLLRACRQEMLLRALKNSQGGSVWGRIANYWRMLMDW